MNYYELKPLAENNIENIVIFLHGYGADGRDLINIGSHWQKKLPNTYFLSLDAPFPFEGGPVGFQWFSLANMSLDYLAKGVQKARPHVEALIENLKKTHGILEEKIALVGFSQGTMVSLSCALNSSKPFAGVVCYSGAYIPEPGKLKSRPDVLMLHGTEDEVLPVNYYRISKENLRKLGVNVTGYLREGLAHGIDEWGLETGHQFLREKLYK